jgi:DNA-binding response OmpR family regulator
VLARDSARLPRILLIDDTPEIAELLMFALRDHGHEVFAEGYTDTVNDLIRDLRADALVLDCTVFDMSESLFDIVRRHPNHAEFPIVIISDTPEKADASLGSRNAQKVLLIPKPFTGSQVARAIDQLLG